MKKLLILPILICFTIQSGNLYAYELTTSDTAIVSRATTKLEGMIKVKWETYRNLIIRMLSSALGKLKSDGRTYALVNKTVENLQPKNVQKKPTIQIGTPFSNKPTAIKTNDYDPALFDKGGTPDNNSSSTITTSVRSWNIDILYEAISGGKTSKDIENGKVKFDPTTIDQTMVVSAINKVRADYGLPPLVFNEALAKAAKNHSAYMINNGSGESHFETLGKSGFTGKDVLERAEKAGYLEWNTSEVIAFFRWDIVTSIRQLLYVPYHRTAFLEDKKDIGFCLEKDCFGILVFGGDQTSQNNHFVYPKNGSNIYSYNSHIAENPDPFPWLNLTGFVVSILDAEGVEKDSIRFVDVTEDRSVPITFASDFSPLWQDRISVSVKKLGASQKLSWDESAVHFINRESLKEGHTYMTEYSTRNVGDNLCKIRRSYFIAGSGAMPDVSKLLPTESSQCGNIVPKSQQNGSSPSTSNQTPESDAGALEVTGDIYIVSQKYGNDPEFSAFTYTDDGKKRNYLLQFNDSDTTWLLIKKKSTGQAPPSKDITGMYVTNGIKLKISSIRKIASYGDSGSGSGYESYNASASVVR